MTHCASPRSIAFCKRGALPRQCHIHMRQRVHHWWIRDSDKGVHAHLPLRRILLSNWRRLSPKTLSAPPPSCSFRVAFRCCCDVRTSVMYTCNLGDAINPTDVSSTIFQLSFKENGFKPVRLSLAIPQFATSQNLKMLNDPRCQLATVKRFPDSSRFLWMLESSTLVSRIRNHWRDF